MNNFALMKTWNLITADCKKTNLFYQLQNQTWNQNIHINLLLTPDLNDFSFILLLLVSLIIFLWVTHVVLFISVFTVTSFSVILCWYVPHEALCNSAFKGAIWINDHYYYCTELVNLKQTQTHVLDVSGLSTEQCVWAGYSYL